MSFEALDSRLTKLNWSRVVDDLIQNGYSQVEEVLSHQQCEQLKKGYSDESGYRKTVNMRRYRFGEGEYKYFDYPLPDLVERLRGAIYPYLVPVANAWMKALKIDVNYPSDHSSFVKQCAEHSQKLATPLMLKYIQGGFNTLHQDLYGEIYFPIQAVINLSQAGVDYQGGELVLSEQVPRAQSRAKVIQPNKGDMIIFSTKFRPQRGTQSTYRVTMKHGVSEITQGTRYALGIIFHDAKQ